jgi:hypothetical protein
MAFRLLPARISWRIGFALLFLAAASRPADAVERGAMGELSFPSRAGYVEPFAVALQATFTQDTTRYTFWGFYAGNPDGVDTWKVRYNLPATGVWSYETVSSDPWLNGRTGSVTITPPAPGNRGVLIGKDRALVWENTGEPYFVLGQTAYRLLHKNVPWIRVLDWLQANGFNHIRVDLTNEETADAGYEDLWLWGGTPGSPEYTRFDLAQWDKVDQVLSEGLRRGFTFELGLKTTRQLPLAGPLRTRYLRYVAARLGAYPHLVYLETYELWKPVREGGIPTPDVVKAIGREIAAAFESYPRKPLVGLHTARNFTYHEGRAGAAYPHVRRGPANPAGGAYDFRGESWLTCVILHERWKMEGLGILQHRPHFPAPMYIGEAVYETTDRKLKSPADELDAVGIRDQILQDPRFYYRRYTYSVILSGGTGLTYGLQGDSSYTDSLGRHIPRWSTGLPWSRDGRNGAGGFKDMKRALDYFRAKRLDVNALVPDDTRVSNGVSPSSTDVPSESPGLRRAKFARLGGENRYFAYNPYFTDLAISGIPAGLRIEILDPQTGAIYAGGRTDGGTVFKKPTQFAGDYLLYIAPPGTLT